VVAVHTSSLQLPPDEFVDFLLDQKLFLWSFSPPSIRRDKSQKIVLDFGQYIGFVAYSPQHKHQITLPPKEPVHNSTIHLPDVIKNLYIIHFDPPSLSLISTSPLHPTGIHTWGNTFLFVACPWPRGVSPGSLVRL